MTYSAISAPTHRQPADHGICHLVIHSEGCLSAESEMSEGDRLDLESVPADEF